MAVRFSILTPSYNQGEFIERCIQSVLKQDVAGTQHIIMDGGSTDQTVEILKRYDPQLYAWRSEPDGGQSDALRKALDLSTNEIIGWINTDDYYEPNVLGRVAEEFERHPRAVIVYGDHRQVTASGEQIRLNRHWRFDYEVCKVQTPIITNCAAFFRRDRLIECGGFDPRYHYCMDWELYIRLMAGGAEWRRLKQPLGCMTMHLQSKTATSTEKFMREVWEIRRRYLPGWSDEQIERYRKRQERRMKWHMLLDGVFFEKVWFKFVTERHYTRYFGGTPPRLPLFSHIVDWLDPVVPPVTAPPEVQKNP